MSHQRPRFGVTLAAATASIALAAIPVGCSSLPGNDEQQGAVGGGVAGAAAGALIGGEDNRLIGALIGGAAGAGGGYLVGANWDKISGEERDEAIKAGREAETDPATANDVRDAKTADLNDNGFVTLDEVAAMEKADLSDDEIVDRLRATDQYFELTSEQENFLRDRDVSDEVIREMRTMSADGQRAAGKRLGSTRISRDRN